MPDEGLQNLGVPVRAERDRVVDTDQFGNDISETTQLILRTAFGYRFAPGWSGWLGYAWSPTLAPFEFRRKCSCPAPIG